MGGTCYIFLICIGETMNQLFGYILKGCYFLTKNYVGALLLFALAMQILLLYFGIRQQKNMVKQATLRPKEMAIRKKYAGRSDKATSQKCQQEIMEMYQKEGYSQLAGCLPMLLQLIIIFPIYQVVIRPLEFICGLSKEACGELWYFLCQVEPDSKPPSTYQIDVISKIAEGAHPINDLGHFDLQGALANVTIDNVSLFGQNLGVTPFESFGKSYWWLIFIPIINLGLMYLSQFLSKKFSYQNPQAEAMNSSSMKIMMYVLPLMTMFITFRFAAAIGIYWIFRTILSIIQQVIIHKVMPLPKFTEEDFKNAEKELKSQKNGKSGGSTRVIPQREYRSLHHIDD